MCSQLENLRNQTNLLRNQNRNPEIASKIEIFSNIVDSKFRNVELLISVSQSEICRMETLFSILQDAASLYGTNWPTDMKSPEGRSYQIALEKLGNIFVL